MDPDVLSFLGFELMTATTTSSGLHSDWNINEAAAITPDSQSLTKSTPSNPPSRIIKESGGCSSRFPGALNTTQLASYLSELQLLIQPSFEPDFSPIDLKLMHQFTISTSISTSRRSEIQQIWAHEIPQLAHSHKYLMHALLGGAALHLAVVSESADLLPRAAAHHQAAVRGIAEELRNINAENCHTLLAAQMILHFYALCWPRLRARWGCSTSPSSSSSTSPSSASSLYDIDTIALQSDANQLGSWIRFLRCTFGFLERCWEWLPSGIWRPLMHPPASYTTLDMPSESRLSELFRLCTDRTLPDCDELNDMTTASAYFIAIGNLRPVYGAVNAAILPDEVRSAISQYAIRTPSRFWDALEMGRPRALVIYAHYCIVYEELGFWWVQGQSEWDLERVERRLPVEWRNWLEWPWRRLRERGKGGGGMGRLADVGTAGVGEEGIGMMELLESPQWP